MNKSFLGERIYVVVSNSFICILLMFLVMFLGMPEAAFGYNANACAKKKCALDIQTHPAIECISGQLPSGDLVCFTEFTIRFPQTVRLSATNIDKNCGGVRCGFFIIRKPDWTEAYAYNMGNPAFGWSADETIAPGTYRLEPSSQWGGTYCVEYFSGPPNCSANLSITPNGTFGNVNIGDCSEWGTATLKNVGNVPFAITGILSGDPVFELNTNGMPGTLNPDDDFQFKVKFCAPSGLSADTPYSDFITVNYSCNSTTYTKHVAVSGTAHVPKGVLSVNSSLDVGEADWTLPPPGNRTEANLNISNVGDATMNVSVTLENDGGGVFTLPSGGNVGTINDGSSRPCTVRAVVSGETTYTGSLRVVATYPGAGSDEKIVTLQAKGHHPVSKLVLLTNEINYHEVEAGYAFTQAIKIRNDGDADLTFNIGLVDNTDPDIDHFQLHTGSCGPVVPGKTVYIEMKFSPLDNGNKKVEVVVNNSNDPTWVPANVRLYGTGVAPKALSTMLVIDRSGSMDGSAGDVRKIEAASDAGKLYVNILHDDWDYLGITSYNKSNSTIVPLGKISDNRTDALDNLKDCTNPSGVLYPDGSTGIGGAMQTASAQFAPSISPTGNAQAMIVLTDGKENEEPYISETLPDIIAAYPDLKIFCVGIGKPIETGDYGIEGIETEKLELIASSTRGLFKIVQAIKDNTRYDLEAFYFGVFSIAAGRQTALDPTYLLPYSEETQEIARVNIADCDRDADFLILSESFKDTYPYYSIYLEDPTGQVITPSSTIGGIAVHIKKWGNAQLVRVKFPPRAEADKYSGEWKLFIKPEPIVFESTNVPLKKKSNPRTATYYTNENYDIAMGQNSYHPVGFAVSVGSDYRMKASVTKAKVFRNQPIQLSAELTEAWWPAPNGSIIVEIRKPNGSRETETMFDDGLHEDGAAGDGKFGLVYRDTYQTGYYEFLFQGTGLTERGYKVTREELLSKHVAPFFGGIFDGGLPGYRRFAFSFHVGATYPLGDMNSFNDSNVHVRSGLSYWLTKRLQIMLMIGFSQFTAEWNPRIEHPYWFNFSANIKMVTNPISGTGLRLYFQGGPGYYRSKIGSYDVGFNLGIGGQIPISPFSLEFGLDYHQIKNEEHNKFLTFQLGVLFN